MVNTGLEGKGGRMRGKGKVWILQLGCQTSKIFGPSMYFIKKKRDFMYCLSSLRCELCKKGWGVYIIFILF